jgi:hypothetical protein
MPRIIVHKPAQWKKGERPPHCVKCGTTAIQPGLCYTGKVLEGFATVAHEKAILDTVSLEYSLEVHKFKVPSYIKGLICDECAGEYRSVRLQRGGTFQDFPIIVTDPVPANQPREQHIGGKSNKGFNTRITQ